MTGWFRGLALATAVATSVLVVLGGVVRVTGSGLGCPDWPLCYGSILPPWQLEAVIEYTHRLVSSAIVGPLVLATTVVAWVLYRRQRWLVVPATLAVALLAVQAALGAVAVRSELSPGTVAAHFALGEALLASLVVVYVAASRGALVLEPGSSSDRMDPLPKLALVSAIGLYLLMLSGSYVTVSGATAACGTHWPLCQGGIFPDTQLPRVHMAHRFASVLIGAFLMYTLHLGIRDRRRPPQVRLVSMATATLFLAQVLVGALTVWLGFPGSLSALHVAMATAVWGAMVALVVLTFAWRPAPAKEPLHA
jgi:heme A synthase